MKKILLTILLLSLTGCSPAPISIPQDKEVSLGGMVEIKSLRTHTDKHFDIGNGQRILRQSFGLVHYYDGKEFQDIVDIPFPEGKEIKSEADLDMITCPSWGSLEVEVDGSKAYIKDKLGKRIFVYHSPIVAKKGDKPFKIIKDKNGVDTKVKDEKVKTDKAKFKINGNSIAFELPVAMESKNLQAYDDVDTGSTNGGNTFLSTYGPTTNYGGSTVIDAYSNGTGKERGIIKFTLSSGTGTISDIKLYLYKNTTYTAVGVVNMHELTRTNWEEMQATWNIYKTGSNWTTAGGDYNATVVDSITPGAGNEWEAFGIMGATATNPLTKTWGDTVSLILKQNTESGTEHGVAWPSKEYTDDTSKRPYIEITYTATGGVIDTNNLIIIE